MISATSVGAGKYIATASRSGWIPLFLNDVPQTIGVISIAKHLFLIPAVISSSVNSSPPRYLSINSSLDSAAASTNFSLYSLAVSTKSAGISSILYISPACASRLYV